MGCQRKLISRLQTTLGLFALLSELRTKNTPIS